MLTPDRERAAADSWQRTLATIPTVLGRLAYLASLRDANTGTYIHFGLAQRIGEGQVDALIRKSHMAVFQEWLCFNLERQTEELEEYWGGLEGDRREILANWLTLKPYAGWVPRESRDLERRLFYADFGVVLELIRAETGVVSPDPDS